MVSLELEKVQNSFAKLDKYNLDEYFVFEDDTFISQENLQDTKIGLMNRARELTVRSIEELEQGELKKVLEELEVVPGKVERFFRKSVKYAINQCDDTKRLKELLTLI